MNGCGLLSKCILITTDFSSSVDKPSMETNETARPGSGPTVASPCMSPSHEPIVGPNSEHLNWTDFDRWRWERGETSWVKSLSQCLPNSFCCNHFSVRCCPKAVRYVSRFDDWRAEAEAAKCSMFAIVGPRMEFLAETKSIRRMSFWKHPTQT